MRVNAPRLFASLVPQVLVLLLAACSDGKNDADDPPAPPPDDTTAPSVPAGVTAVAQSGSAILISWTASTDAGTGVAGYHIFRDGVATAIATVTTPSYTDGSLTSGTNYSYTVSSFDAATPANESALSGSVSATTIVVPVVDVTPPSVPANLVASAQSPTDVRLTWSASTDAGTGVGGYRVFRDGGATPITTVTGNVYVNTGLTANTAYTYTVRAFDLATPANESGPSTTATVTTLALPDTTIPTTPGSLTATVLSNTQIRLNWTASTDLETGISAYRVFNNVAATGTAIAVVTSGTTYTVPNLTASTQYTFSVRAVDGATPTANVSSPSNSVTATTQAAPDTTAPSVPANVVATTLSPSSISITWAASIDSGTGVAGYRIFRNGSTTVLATVTGSTTYTDTGLNSSTLYSYAIRAFDGATPANVSGLSTAASATTQSAPDTTAPTVPAGVTATALSSSQIRLNWTASTDAGTGVGGYRIFRDGSTTVLATVTSGTTYTNAGLAANTSYSYTIAAFDLNTPTPNVSALSSAASATTQMLADTTPPTVPAGVTATALSSSQIRIDWTASTDMGGAGVAGYRIFRDGNTSVLATVTSGTTYTDTGLTASTLYSYALRAYDASPAANTSALSTAATATTQAPSGQPSGLDTRPSNTTCLAGAPPSQSSSFTFQRVYPALSFADPIAIMQAPGDNSRWFVAQQGGIVKTFSNVANPTSSTNFIDISGRITYSGGGDERGLLGMAFHPNYPTDPRVYLYYTGTDATLGAVDRVSEFRTTDGGATLNASTEVELFDVDDPESNHNGGNIVFGPDGYLYIGIGDGGGGNDQHGSIGNAQNLTTMLGKMLRINIGSTPGAPYSIPANNPFVGGARCNVSGTGAGNCPEIYAYGFRNPWRWSFDRTTGDLWVGDVGEGAWEEIDKVTLGGNYGWRCREGNHSTGSSCGPNTGAINPIAEIAHPNAAAITGGYVYRGSAIPGLNGRYIFGDYSSGYLWNIARDTNPTLVLTTSSGLATPAQISSFGEDQARELYFLDFSNGWIYKIVPGAGGGGNIATLLSQSGCANASNPKLPASGMIPYAPNAAFWSDSAVKSRWLALPDGQRITIDGTTNDFDLPIGSVLRKDFTLGTVLAETRLFMRHTDGNWAGYTYQWNALGTEATRVISGLTTIINGQTWEFPSESACLVCHTAAAGRTLGLETGQLNGPLLYPATGRTANQLFTLNFIDTLTPAITLPVEQLPLIPNPYGTSGTQIERARAWLHTNCANCHRPSGGTPVNIDFRYTTTLLGTNSCDVQPTSGDLGITNARLIAPGDAARSVVVARVNRVGANQMPPLARHQVDAQGVALLTSWVNGLTGCN